MPTRLLTNRQIGRLLARWAPEATAGAVEALPADERVEGFALGTSTVGELRMEGLIRVAEAFSEAFVANLNELVPACGAPDDACADALVSFLGRRLHRRPVETSEMDDYASLFDDAGGGESGLRAVVETMFLSGDTLYDVEEPVTEPGVTQGFDLATKLSLLLLDEPPRDDLLDAAQDGELDQVEGVRAWASRLLDDSGSADAIGRFYSGWLGFEDREEEPELSEAARHELRDFTHRITVDEEATFADLYTSRDAVVSEPLAEVYGIDAAPGEWVTLGPERAGVLTRAAFLLQSGPLTSPTHRGYNFRQRILCETLPAVPADVEFPPFQEGLTPREFVDYHLSEPSCAGCHQFMDPIGLAFERYDQRGAYRTSYPERPDETIDPAGEVVSLGPTPGDADGTFDSVVALGQRLSESRAARVCFEDRWYRFATARAAMTAADTCELERLDAEFAKGGMVPRDLLVALVTSPAFREESAE